MNRHQTRVPGLQVEKSAAPADAPSQIRRFKLLQSDLSSETADARLRVCILTSDIFGPIKNGGIGSAYFHLARFLVAAGHKVTIAFVHPQAARAEKLAPWIKYYAERSIEFVGVRPDGGARSVLAQTARAPASAYSWLKQHQDEFDMVHVSEWRGLGYYCLLAKHLGLAFQDIHFTVKCSSPTLWNQLGNLQLFHSESMLGYCFMERRSAELADTLISGSHHMLEWMLQHSYELNQSRCFVQPNVFFPEQDLATTGHEPGALSPVDEIVFFGRLEPRKGLLLLCDALNALRREGIKLPPITFLGGYAARFNADELIGRHKANWQTEVKIMPNMNARQALEYLSENNRLAVVASLLENSSIAVYECLTYNIPFLACRTGGTPELINRDDCDQVLVEPRHLELADRLKTVLDKGALVARPYWDQAQSDEVWRAWHSGIAALPQETRTAETEQPKVTICITHHNRRDLLQQTLTSIEAQTYPNFNVVIVDDGSSDKTALAYLDELEAKHVHRDWQIIRQPNLYLGAARNTGARHADGELIVFFDDDNLMQPDMVETLVRAMQHSGSDILTSFSHAFTGKAPPDGRGSKLLHEIRFLGAALNWSFFRNVVGDAACMVRRDVFEELGGYTEHYAIGKDDIEFYNRAMLEGYKLEVVPEPLYFYRLSKDTMKKGQNSYEAGTFRAITPFIEKLPAKLIPFYLYCSGSYEKERRTRLNTSAWGKMWLARQRKRFGRLRAK